MSAYTTIEVSTDYVFESDSDVKVGITLLLSASVHCEVSVIVVGDYVRLFLFWSGCTCFINCAAPECILNISNDAELGGEVGLIGIV